MPRTPARLAALACLVTLPALAQPRPRMDVPVLVGAEPGAGACPRRGEVVGLDPNGDGFLSVRSGPGGRPYSEVSRVHNGQPVFICGESGPWLATVYPSGGQSAEACNVAVPWAHRQPYTGPCAYGWMHGRYVARIRAEDRAPPRPGPPDFVLPPRADPAPGGQKSN